MADNLKALRPHELSVTDLHYLCDERQFSFETTDHLPPLDSVIGQDRAVHAIHFGLSIRSFGYNIYAAGVPGTGKKSLIKSFVERIACEQPVPPDLLYVHNFADPDHPVIIQVPVGMGAEFKRDMERLVSSLKEGIPKAFQSEEYERRKEKIIDTFQKKRAEIIAAVQEEARHNELLIKGTESQIMTVPLINGEEVAPEAFEQLPEETQEKIRQRQRNLSDAIKEAYRQIRDLQQKTQERIRELDRRMALTAEGHFLDHLSSKYGQYEAIVHYLKEVQEDVLDNLGDFLPSEQEGQVSQDSSSPRQRSLDRYSVNVIVDNSKGKGAPVITESHPTYKNLIGFLEREVRMGTLHTDFTMVRAGSVLRANGGYLILDIMDLLMSPFSWESLKRVIQNKEVKIEDVTEQFGFMAAAGLSPQPVAVDLKVIVSGSAEVYHALYNFDEDFAKLFKIKADFDTVAPRNEETIGLYARYIKRLCDDEGLKQFDREAVAALIEYSARVVSDQSRLTLRFSDVADLVREASYWAGQRDHPCVRREDVTKAIEDKVYRSNLVEARMQEMIDEDSILIETSGEKVGQINGLSVYQLGSYTFGKPTRITAQVSVGDKGVVNIEREARLSGSIHDKGVLILSGYLHGKYGQNCPLALYASICFEQSYTGVDGDSASSTELYSIISSLSGVPLRQSIAVTGSVNQLGMIQPIGGVNEKIEGYFATCRADGLTGDQGVIIPWQNVRNLMLRQEVTEAVQQGKFHIYAIRSVDEGLEILTGRKAGEVQADGTYPLDTIHFLAQRRLREMADNIRQFSREPKTG